MKQVPAIFQQICKQNGLPEPEPEVRFHATRRWRFDWAWKEQRVALEIDGGIWTGGAHGRGIGIQRDHEKGNYAACMGWIVIRCVPKDLHSAATFAFLKQAMKVNARRVPMTASQGIQIPPTGVPDGWRKVTLVDGQNVMFKAAP